MNVQPVRLMFYLLQVMAPHGAVAALASDTSSANQPPPATCDYERSILRELEGQTKPMSVRPK